MLGRADRWLLTPMPAARLASLRILVGLYGTVFLLVRLPAFLDVVDLPARQFEPVGPLVGLGAPVPAGVAWAVLAAAIASGVAFVAGWRWRLTGPVFALTFLAATTYRLSFGHVIHSEHLPALSLLVLAVAPCADAWSLDARRRRTTGAESPPAAPAARYGWPIRLLCVLTVTTYVLAGVAKLRNGGWDWVTGDVLRNQIAYDNLRKALLGDTYSPIGARLVRYGWVFPPLGVATLLVELGAPVALLGGRRRTSWTVAAWSFHIGTAVVMAISFPYPLSVVAFACFYDVERPLGRVAGAARARLPASRGREALLRT